MKHFTLFILAAVLFVGLTFAGKSFFGMDHHMQMGSLECINHCIDSTVVPGVMSSALPVLLFVVVFVLFFVASSRRQEGSPRAFRYFNRLTEPIRLFLLSQNLSTVIIRD